MPASFLAILRRFRARFGAKFADPAAQRAHLARAQTPAPSAGPTQQGTDTAVNLVSGVASRAKRRAPTAGVRFGEASKPGPVPGVERPVLRPGLAQTRPALVPPPRVAPVGRPQKLIVHQRTVSWSGAGAYTFGS
jgi:hypothetical protein